MAKSRGEMQVNGNGAEGHASPPAAQGAWARTADGQWAVHPAAATGTEMQSVVGIPIATAVAVQPAGPGAGQGVPMAQPVTGSPLPHEPQPLSAEDQERLQRDWRRRQYSAMAFTIFILVGIALYGILSGDRDMGTCEPTYTRAPGARLSLCTERGLRAVRTRADCGDAQRDLGYGSGDRVDGTAFAECRSAPVGCYLRHYTTDFRTRVLWNDCRGDENAPDWVWQGPAELSQRVDQSIICTDEGCATTMTVSRFWWLAVPVIGIPITVGVIAWKLKHGYDPAATCHC
eukprot:TRINITY_DN47159_c0_g1_i1.p2 TRINITY_DN47159_c0_g1~~TRINITY_DN47159_c0_g1_i1.p2  ORF type:complete len:314 (+),score=84.27 TRINITY_DN47159_c0_g1_i1:79-942(+)